MVDYKITDRPIEGEVNSNTRHNEPQITPAEFLQLVDKVLNLPHVTAIVWDQYTPYFNDGDECVFSVYEARLRFDNRNAEDEEGGSEYDDGYSTWEFFNYGPFDEKTRSYGDRIFHDMDGTSSEVYYDALSDFNNSARWESIARENFGDHAEVTATKEGFSVEYYEHD